MIEEILSGLSTLAGRANIVVSPDYIECVKGNERCKKTGKNMVGCHICLTFRNGRKIYKGGN